MDQAARPDVLLASVPRYPHLVSETVLVADVALDPRSGGADAVYTYAIEPGIGIGEALFVPLGNRSALGFITDIYEADEEALGFPLDQLKSHSGRVQGLAVPPVVVELSKFVSREYLCSLAVALTAATPPGVRERLVVGWRLKPNADLMQPLTPLQKEIIRTLVDSDGCITETKSKKIPQGTVRALKILRSKDVVEQTLEVAPFSERRKADKLLRLTPDDKQIDDFLKIEGKKKPAQAVTLMRLQGADRAALSPSEIRALGGVTDSTIRALVDAKLLIPVDQDVKSSRTPPKPNPEQSVAIDAITDAVVDNEYRPFLLYGVTGSGKTEVYMRAAAEALKMGRQVLYIVPEIALAAQAIAQLHDRFGRSVAVLHSELSASERLQNWVRVRNGEASIVLGARSACFAPLTNIGLIIVDEEHEASYKQESAPRYHAKRVLEKLGQLHRCPVLFGSATPSVESFYEAEHEKLTLLSLPERAASAKLPTVFIEDLSEGYKRGQPAILAPNLQYKLEDTLRRGEQAIMFLNRRAYSPFIICRDCGFQAQCPNCAVSLSYHRHEVRLRCHHCGYQTRPPDTCPKCGGSRISAFGVGTEKVEEAVAELFPHNRVARLDRDVARKKGALDEVLAEFRSGDIHVLVGTQMVAKGLDFPNVTLVGVIAADMSLNIPDFRSSERTFQLLSQVAGRAGRGQAPGQVVIQTFNPGHVSVLAAQTHDFLSIYDVLKTERQLVGYPPFKRLVNVVASGTSKSAVVQATARVAELLRSLRPALEVLGPTDCPIERLQNRWRRHLLVKLPPDGDVASIGDAMLGVEFKGVQIVLDVDPYSMM